ncbi:hypothetical protein HJFPF1_05923 [Paramyrothecium foliicola]|nr:hypothetical protein HJFPF1_05923 [Paramyrothecium foliicola]
MPVTIKVALHGSAKWSTTADGEAKSQSLLTTTLGKHAKEVEDVLQSSISDQYISAIPFRPANNGLVMTAFNAYTTHQNLVIRPEDVWFAVLSQFSFYVNAHSEELRGSFVSHKGKKGLVLEQEFSDKVDFGSMCENMTRLIDQNIVDPKLRAWVLPSFTTTTPEDSVVASALMMGMLQKYFEYIFDPCCCGIPNLTLLGEKEDYEDILGRLEKLTEYGKEPTYFARLLRPVVRHMVASFSAPPNDKTIQNFWSRIVHHNSGSGFSRLSGWITAFCLWDEKGKCFASSGLMSPTPNDASNDGHVIPAVDDQVVYHEVDMQLIPSAYITVPVTVVQDDGASMLKTKILAGSIGTIGRTAPGPYPPAIQQSADNANGRTQPLRSTKMKIPALDKHLDFIRSMGSFSESANTTEIENEEGSSSPNVDASTIDTLQPLSGWWIYSLKNGKLNISKEEYLEEKKATWEGGLSIGRVLLNGDMYMK